MKVRLNLGIFKMTSRIDIKENTFLYTDAVLLDLLLYDNTTKRNIIWATDNYEKFGIPYAYSAQIYPELITDKNGNIIRPRGAKTLKEQTARVKDKAEVFTPSWICNAQNNLVDSAWFGRTNVFNKERNQSRIVNSKRIEFPTKKTWQDYVLANRMEVSCGEAPYLVSRYDTITGKPILLKRRIGLLDRKLRVGSENTENVEDWYKWAVFAFKSAYGFEWQGDNLLLARENLLYSFCDYYKSKFGGSPSRQQMLEIANIISWNIWQMDGLKGVVPNTCHDTIREAKALSALLKEHEIFLHFEIANVAGDGDEEQNEDGALKVVRNAIDNNQYTITLSFGKLTTGVTVKEWTAVLMLAGAYSTSAMGYLQTIFRVQSPAVIDGKQKEVCYVFDFAPDRTLKMMADAVNMSTKAGKTDGGQKKAMGKLLNFRPIISIDGTNMREYDVDQMLTQLKRAYIDKVSQNGFDDAHIYNYNIGAFSEKDKEFIKHLSAIVKASNQSKAPSDIPINDLGVDNEEHEKDDAQPKSDSQKQKSEENKKKKEERERRRTLISNLRAISIRIPLLVYGADIPFEQDINIDNLTDIVDDVSWEKFMPKGLSKEDFKRCKKFYDETIFVGAGRAIRNRVKDAEKLPVTERVREIAEIFGTFRNPDKETVLTPWCVVNIHLGNCLGGFNFFDEDFKHTLETPRCIDHGKVSEETVWNTDAKILEVNSKTGLYPLYMAYSVFTARRQKKPEVNDEQHWADTLKENIFVLCKTPMAVSITRRTLAGFRNLQVNAKYRKNLVKDAQEEISREKLVSEIQSGKNFWKINEDNNMKFGAIVGNPPYQISDGGNKASSMPIYNIFVELEKQINPNYLSMIMPARWFGGRKGLNEFRTMMLNDNHISKLYDYNDARDCFPTVDIAGGICYFLRDIRHNGKCWVTNNRKSEQFEALRPLNEFPTFIRDCRAISIMRKVLSANEPKMSEQVSSSKPFGLRTFVRPMNEGGLILRWQNGEGPYKRSAISVGLNMIDEYKVITSYVGYDHAGTPGSDGRRKVFSRIDILPPGTICNETYLVVGHYKTKTEAENLVIYMKTMFFRFLVSQFMYSHHITKETYAFVPVLDQTKTWTDSELYKKYKLTDIEESYIAQMIRRM